MATIGELNDFGVVDLLDLLGRRKRSGPLAVTVGGQEIVLHVERDWVTESDLGPCLEDQSIEVLSKAMTDENGMLVFDVGTSPAQPPEARPLNSLALLQYAKERSDALVKLREQLPAPGTPLFLAAHAVDDPSLAGRLSAPEAMVVGVLLGGPKSYGELITHLARDERSLGVAVITLVAGGTIVTTGPASGRPASATPRPPARYAAIGD